MSVEREAVKCKVLAVCFDTGAAEQISAIIVKERQNFEWQIVCPSRSPARAIFQRKGIPVIVSDTILDQRSLSNFLFDSGASLLVAGTSWQGYELDFIRAAKRIGLRTLVSLDHWINYRERFGYPHAGWKDNVPDYLAVHDRFAFDEARALGFDNVVRLRNYYLEETCTEAEQRGEGHRMDNRLVFLSEIVPSAKIKSNSPTATYLRDAEEFAAIHALIEGRERLKTLLGIDQLVIRKHPGDPIPRYEKMAVNHESFRVAIENPHAVRLATSLAEAKIVVGFGSMALFVALAMGKIALSFNPLETSYSPMIRGVQRVYSVDQIIEYALHPEPFPLQEHLFAKDEWSFRSVYHRICGAV